MRLIGKATVVAVLSLWMIIFAAAQQPTDLVGTWSGEATLEGLDEPNVLTLVLEIKEGKLAGHMTDQFGAIDGEIKDIVLEKDAFNFSAQVNFDGQQGTIHFKMKLSSDNMNGVIEIPEMSAKGTWQATKKK